MTFFSHRPQISNFPSIFPVSIPFPPCFAKSIISPLFWQISPLFWTNSAAFYIIYVYFVSPLLSPWCICASPNARTGRPWGHQEGTEDRIAVVESGDEESLNKNTTHVSLRHKEHQKHRKDFWWTDVRPRLTCRIVRRLEKHVLGLLATDEMWSHVKSAV